MAKEKSIVEEAIIQMKNLEEAVAENAKGILASTMKEEISELVKESLSEQEEDEIETDVEVDDTDMEDSEDSSDVDSEEGETDDVEIDDTMSMVDTDTDMMDMSSDEETPIDLSNEPTSEVLRVFELLGPDDKIVVKKDGAGNINLKDNESNKEYMIVGESEEEFDEEEMYEEEMDEEMDEEMYEEEDSIESIVDKVFGPESSEEDDEEFEEFEEEESVMYEIEMDEEEEELDEEDDVVYEIEMDDEEEEEESEFIGESKITKKPKGVGIGKPKFSYKGKPNMEGGFKTVKKKSDKAMGTGSAKKVNIYKEKTNMDGKNKVVKGVKKMETKESSRTLGAGRNFGRKGLPKPKASPRHIRLESTDAELQILRQKNEEYRKALNVFRNKLNEVAVFNSNLAYATRLFTEHSTSKQEKINILRRFDNVETLKESKNLYKQLKDELGNTKTEQLTESVERVIQKSPSTGSATTLIESKTYENPQFLRMKDLMSKLK